MLLELLLKAHQLFLLDKVRAGGLQDWRYTRSELVHYNLMTPGLEELVQHKTDDPDVAQSALHQLLSPWRVPSNASVSVADGGAIVFTFPSGASVIRRSLISCLPPVSACTGLQHTVTVFYSATDQVLKRSTPGDGCIAVVSSFSEPGPALHNLSVEPSPAWSDSAAQSSTFVLHADLSCINAS